MIVRGMVPSRYSITAATGGCPRNWTSVTLMSLLNLLSPDWVC